MQRPGLTRYNAGNMTMGTGMRSYLVTLALGALAFGMAACQKPGTVRETKGDEPDGAVTILFAGDFSYGENYGPGLKLVKKRGYDFSLRKLAPMLRDADFVIANLETPVTDLKESPYADSKAYCHWTDVVHTPRAMNKYGIRTVSLANNHTLDFGLPGLMQTFDVLGKAGITVFGAGKTEKEARAPFVKDFPVGGQTFTLAVFGAFEYSRSYDKKYSFYAKGDKPGASRLSAKGTGRVIRQFKKENPNAFAVAYPHWGGNYSWATKKQKKLAPELLTAGADLIVGHGARQYQQFEKHDGRWIVYNLGNFMFNSPGRYKMLKAPNYSMTAKLIVYEKGGKLRADMKLYPILCNNRVTKYNPRPLTDEEFEEALGLQIQKSGDPAAFAKYVRRGKDNIGPFLKIQIM
ncbi:MAG: CapA family protein [Deltaproteobacteria bacterium]|nr:CapA family protein [Deltaproteobacteria bacterium]